MMKKLTTLVLIIGLVACSSEPQEHPNKQSKDSLIRVTDFTGEEITLDKPAQRIVALAPHIVENVFTAGAGEQLIGVVAYSDFPRQAKLLPLVGGYAKTNLEKILELNPDLIIAWESGNSDASVARIKELGYPVYVDQPDSLTDLSKSIRDIGTLTGHVIQANKAMDEYLASIAETKALYESKPKVSTFYQVWNQPLRTITGKHIISDAIRLCGGTNIYANEPSVSPIINIESLLERDPQAIIASGMSEARPEWLDDWKKWPSLQSVKNNNLFFVNPNHIQRHTVRILLGIESICAQLDEARAKNG
jgi:iron complex transport system substrate-binding protein